MSTLYVNALWKSEEDFNANKPADENAIWGTNAFQNYKAAFAKAKDGDTIRVTGTYGWEEGYTDIGSQDGALDVNVVFDDGASFTTGTGATFRIDNSSTATLIGDSNLNSKGNTYLRGTLNIGSKDGGKASATINAFNLYGEDNAEDCGGKDPVNTAVINVYDGSSLTMTDTTTQTHSIGKSATRNGLLNIEGGSVDATYLTINAGSAVNISDGGSFTVQKTLTNNGTINVSGESDIKATVTGDGWIYMNSVNLDSDTQITGANIRFASGLDNVVDGAVLNIGRAGKFQVGAGDKLTSATDERDANVDFKKGVAVTVKNSKISGTGSSAPYGGWVGSEYCDGFSKSEIMTDARFTLNIENSTADFGYLHVSTDGILKISGAASEKMTYSRGDIPKFEFDSYIGDFTVNGEAELNNTSIQTLYTKVYNKLTVSGATLYAVGGDPRQNGITVNGGELNVSNASEVYANHFSVTDGTVTLNGDDVTLTMFGLNAAKNVNDGIIKIESGAKLVGAKLNDGYVPPANYNLSNYVTFTNNKDITITGGMMDIDNIVNAGTITVTAKSVGDVAAITADTITGTGVITIDAADFSGVKKVIDISDETQKWEVGSNIKFENLGKTQVAYGADGDVTLVNVDTDTIFVNSAWKDYESGQAIAGSDNKLAFGVNAFADFRKALAVTNENKGGNIVLADEKYSWKNLEKDDPQRAMITQAGTYDISGGDGVLFNYEFEVNPDKADGKYIVKIHDAYFTCGKFTMRKNATVTIDNSVIDSVYNKATNTLYDDGTNYFSVYMNSSVTVNNSKIGYTPESAGSDKKYGTIFQVYGTATFNNSEMYAYVSSAIEHGLDVYGNGTFTMKDTDVYCSVVSVGLGYAEKYLMPNTDKTKLLATMVFDGSTVQNTSYKGDHNATSMIIVGNADNTTAGKLIIKSKAELDFRQTFDNASILEIRNDKSSVEISGGSSLDIAKISNKGSFTVDNSTVVADSFVNDKLLTMNGGLFDVDKVTNNGDFTVKGTSTLDIDSLTGGIDIAPGTTLIDSNIHNDSQNYSLVLDGITFEGDNVIHSGAYTTGGCAITVAEGSTLKATGGRFTFGSGSVFTATGELAAGAALKLDAEALETAEKTLDLAGISISGTSTSTMTVTNAYVNLGNVSTAKNSSGTFNFNFTNSYVTTSVRWAAINSKDTLAGLNITLDGSVFAPAVGFTQESKKGVLSLINGSRFTTNVMRNYGTVNIDSTSKVELTSYFQSSHGGQYGTINVNGGEFLVSGGNEEFDMREGAVLNVNGGKFSFGENFKQALTLEKGAAININGGTLEATTALTNAGSLTMTGKSTVSGKNLSNSGSMTVGKDSVYNHEGNFWLNAGELLVQGYVNSAWTGMTRLSSSSYNTILTVDGTYAANDNNNGKFINTGNVALSINSKGELKVIHGGTFSMDGKLNNSQGSITVSDSTLSAGYIYTNGTMTIEGNSSITAVDGFVNQGTININVADDWSGVATVIDSKAGTSKSDFGTVKIHESDEGRVFWDVNASGDLVVYTKDFSTTVYVDSNFVGDFGDKVADGKFFGINAFDNLENFIVNTEVATLNIAGGTYTPTAGNWVELLKDGVTAVTTDGLVVAEKGNLYFSKSEAGTYTISGSYQTTGTEGFLWENGQNLGWKTNGVIRFQGADGVVFNITDANITSSAAIQFIGGKSVIAADSVVSSDAQKESKMAVYGDVVNYGKIELVTTGNPGTALLIGHNSYASNANKLTVSGENASVMIDTGATVDANIHSTGTLIVENNAEFTATGSVVNDGKVTVDGADFSAGKLTNNGAFTVSGESKLDINLEGEGTFLIDDAVVDGTVNVAWREDAVDNAGKVVTHQSNLYITGDTVIDGSINNLVQTLDGYEPRTKSDNPADGEAFYAPYQNTATAGKVIMGTADKDADVVLNGDMTGSKISLVSGSLKVTDGAGIYGTFESLPSWMNVNVNGGYLFCVGDYNVYNTDDNFDVVYDGVNPIAEMTLESGSEFARFGHILIGSNQHDKGADAYILNVEKGASVKEFAQITTRGDGTINVDGDITSYTTISYQSSSADATWMHENAKDGGHINNNGIINVSETGSVKINSMNVGRKPDYGNAELNINGGTVEFMNYINVGYDASARVGELNITAGGKLVSYASEYELRYNNGKEAGIKTVEKEAGTLTVGVAANGSVTVDNGGIIDVGTVNVGEKGSMTIDSSDLTADTLVNNNDITLKGTATFDVEDFDNNATLTLEGFNGTLTGVTKLEDEAVTGNIEVYDKTVIKDSFDTALLSVGAKLAKRKLGSDSLTIADGVTANMANLYVKASSSMNIAAGAEVNVIGFYNKTDGLFASYGTTNVDGTLNVSNNSGCGYNKIGYTSYANEDGVAVVNVNDGGVFNLNTIGGDGATNSLVIDTDGTLNVNNGGTFNADDRATVVNNGIFQVSGSSTVNADITGNVTLKENATLNGKLSADTVTIEKNAVLGEKATLDAVINGGKLAVSGNANTLIVGANSTGALSADGATFTYGDDVIGNIAITGNGGEFTADEALFNGNSISGIKLNVTNEDGNGIINVNTGLDNIKAINGNEVKNFDGVYYFTEEVTNDNGTPDDTSDDVISFVTNILSKDENGITYAAQGSGDGDDSVAGEKEFGNIVIDNKTGDSINPDLDVVMKKGTTTIKVGKGKEFAIGSIAKNENGGKTDLDFADSSDATINGYVDSFGNLTVGKDADFDITGALNGKNINQNIKIGAGSTADFSAVDMMGGKNTFSVAAGATVNTGKLDAVTTLSLANGKADDLTEMTVDGKYTAAAANNSVKLGNYAKLTVTGDFTNGGVESGTGTTFKAGNYSKIIVENVDGLAGLTIGKESTFDSASISGTENSNKINIGADSDLIVDGAINLKDGKNSITLGKEAGLTAASIANVQTITLAADADLTAAGINGVQKLTLGKAATLDVDAVLEGVQKFTAGNESEVYLPGLNGTEKNDAFTFGNDSTIGSETEKVAFNGYAGNDSIKIGNNAIAHIASIDLGDGKDTVTLGKDSKIFVDEITNVETINASKGSQIITRSDVNFDAVGGSWKNATIVDVDNILTANAGAGAVYGNEWDLYDLAAGTTSVMIADETNSNTIYKVYEKGVWDKAVGEITSIDTQFIGDLDASKNYVLAVSVEGADFKNKEDEANKYSFTLA